MCLLAAIDHATHTVPWANFEAVEDAGSYLRLLREIIRRHGIPLSVYADRHSIFQVSRKNWTLTEELSGVSSRHRWLVPWEGLASNSSSPDPRRQRVESNAYSRPSGTDSSRSSASSVPRRCRKPMTFSTVTFFPPITKSFTTRAFQPQKIYRRVPRPLDLDRVLSFASEATVGNDNTVRIANLVLDIPPCAPMPEPKSRPIKSSTGPGEFTIGINCS